jgi:hypothetical protein
MSLGAWQSALAALITSHASNRPVDRTPGTGLANLDLGMEEQAWLNQIVTAPGFRVTCSIQRSWRELRLKASARLTLRTLPSRLRAKLLGSWLDGHTDTSFYYTRESTAFLDYILDRLPDDPHLGSICRFERAVLACSAASATFSPETRPVEQLPAGTKIGRHKAASVVFFAAPPEAVFAALLAGAGTALPEPVSERFPLVVAPGLIKLCRPATALELALWDRCSSPISLAWLCQSDAHGLGALQELLEAGVLTCSDETQI